MSNNNHAIKQSSTYNQQYSCVAYTSTPNQIQYIKNHANIKRLEKKKKNDV